MESSRATLNSVFHTDKLPSFVMLNPNTIRLACMRIRDRALRVA
jgi:hypothetical protein